MTKSFDHEKLHVYQASIEFIIWMKNILDQVQKKYSVHDQLDRASTSISLNIAEGNGKYTPKDRCRFFDIARGSALECAAALDIIVAKGMVNANEVLEGKKILKKIVSMLVGLIKNNSPDRVCEPVAKYGND